MEIGIFIQNSEEMLQKCRSISLNRLTISTFIAIYYDYRVFSNLIYFHFWSEIGRGKTVDLYPYMIRIPLRLHSY